MSNAYLTKQHMLNVVESHLREMNAEQYSHRLRIIEFDAAGIENIHGGMYEEISNMIAQYDIRIAALEQERERVLALPDL
jgi:hypothetical protein